MPHEALPCFELAVRHYPRSAWAYNNLGVAFCFRGAFGDAEACFETAIRHDDQLVAPVLNLAHLYACKGLDAEALRSRTHAATLSKNDAVKVPPFELCLERVDRPFERA
jgi:tetratricopeptide (TPR) repeat protein